MILTNWRFWLGLTGSLLFLFILLFKLDLGEIAVALRDANYVYVVPAIGLYFIAVYFRALRWRYLLSPLGSFEVQRLYPVVIIGYMANNLLPARLGELMRSYYFARREGFSASTSLATIAVERVYDGMTLLAFAALAVPVLVLVGAFDGSGHTYRTAGVLLAAFITVTFVGALVVLTLAATPGFWRILNWGLGLVPSRFRPATEQLVHRFVDGLSILSSPRQHLVVFVRSIPVWILEGSMYLLIAYSFGIDDHFSSFGILLLSMVLLTATSNLATAIPTSIGGIGPFEVVAQQTLVAMGVGASVGAAYSGFLHLVALWLPVNLVGLVLVWKQNLSIPKLVGGAMNQAEPTGMADADLAAKAAYLDGNVQPKEEAL